MKNRINISPSVKENGTKFELEGKHIKDPILLQICECNDSIQQLNSLFDKGIINIVGTDVTNLKNKIQELKEQFVLKHHDNEIQHVNIKDRGWVWQTRCRFGNIKRPRYKNKKDLIEYLYEVYSGNKLQSRLPGDFSFGSIFEIALQYKIATEGPKATTISDYRSQYKRFISPELANRDIRTIKPSEMKEYIMNVVTNKRPTKKALYKLKGVLNLVFDYACDPEFAYVKVNPVPKNNNAVKKRCTPVLNRPEDKAFQPKDLELIIKELENRIKSNKYDINAFAILFSNLTGSREGEIPSLKWSDVDFNRRSIHIHAQQNMTDTPDADEVKTSPYVTTSKAGKTIYYYNPATKNERGVSLDGRYVPMRDETEKLLRMLKAKQKELGINSEWVFCTSTGEWINVDSYYSALYRLTKKVLKLAKTNNHAFRIAYNSYVLIPAGLNVTERAKILGHSVDTNLRYYTFSKGNDYLDEITDKLDRFDNKRNYVNDDDFIASVNERSQKVVAGSVQNDQVGHTSTPSYPSPIPFNAKRKSPRTANS